MFGVAGPPFFYFFVLFFAEYFTKIVKNSSNPPFSEIM